MKKLKAYAGFIARKIPSSVADEDDVFGEMILSIYEEPAICTQRYLLWRAYRDALDFMKSKAVQNS